MRFSFELDPEPFRPIIERFHPEPEDDDPFGDDDEDDDCFTL